jgi:hypothetical protein
MGRTIVLILFSKPWQQLFLRRYREKKNFTIAELCIMVVGGARGGLSFATIGLITDRAGAEAATTTTTTTTTDRHCRGRTWLLVGNRTCTFRVDTLYLPTWQTWVDLHIMVEAVILALLFLVPLYGEDWRREKADVQKQLQNNDINA